MVENLENEIWKDVVGYEGKYIVSNLGRVKSLNFGRMHSERIMKQSATDNGYLFVNLWKNNKFRGYRIHRLVYDAFIGGLPKFNVSGKGIDRLEINHKNEIRTDNRLENLELITHKENVRYGSRTEKHRKAVSKKIYQYTINGELVKEWDSIADCSRAGFNKGNIWRCCHNQYGNRINIYKNYKWSKKPPSNKEA